MVIIIVVIMVLWIKKSCKTQKRAIVSHCLVEGESRDYVATVKAQTYRLCQSVIVSTISV